MPRAFRIHPNPEPAMPSPVSIDELTIPMVARELHVHRQTVLGYVWRGALESRRVGRWHVITRDALDRFKAARGSLRPAA
jgi:hypothetical protein